MILLVLPSVKEANGWFSIGPFLYENRYRFGPLHNSKTVQLRPISLMHGTMGAITHVKWKTKTQSRKIFYSSDAELYTSGHNQEYNWLKSEPWTLCHISALRVPTVLFRKGRRGMVLLRMEEGRAVENWTVCVLIEAQKGNIYGTRGDPQTLDTRILPLYP